MKTHGRDGAGPVDQRSVRQHNLGLVIRHVAEAGPRSRARIAAETGLNKTTVSSLVAELIDRGLLCETGIDSAGAVGRPGRKVQVAGDGVAGIGLEIGEWHLGACAVDLTGRVRFRGSVPWENRSSRPDQAIERLATLAKAALDALEAARLTPAGVTVALPGLVDISRGTLFVAPNLEWREVPVAELLRDHLPHETFPIRVDNDANLGALAELREGVGRRHRDFVYVYGEAGTGVGAGIVAGGELFRGPSGFGGELGHMPLARRGPTCRCGNRGCLEVLAGLVALLRLAGLDDYDHRDGLAQRELVARADRGDSRTLRALSEVGRALAMGLTSVANVLSPEALVLGGYFALVADWLVPRIERELADHVLGARWSECRVLVSELGEEAAVRGAAALALHEVLANPTAVRATRPRVVAAYDPA
jgi:predicted NBD/HSP70 family sugar kinase